MTSSLFLIFLIQIYFIFCFIVIYIYSVGALINIELEIAR